MHDGSAKKSLGSHTDEFHSLCYTYFNYETQATIRQQLIVDLDVCVSLLLLWFLALGTSFILPRRN